MAATTQPQRNTQFVAGQQKTPPGEIIRPAKEDSPRRRFPAQKFHVLPLRLITVNAPRVLDCKDCVNHAVSMRGTD